MTVRRIQTAITLPKGKRAPEFYGLGLHSARRQAGVPVGIGILGCNGSRYRKVLRSSCRYLPYIAIKRRMEAMKKSELKELYQMKFPDYPDIVTIKQLREMLGVSRALAYRLISDGEIQVV